MSTVLDLIVIVGTIAFQTYSGYRNNKWMGAILPLIFAVLVIFFIFKGTLTWSFRDIIMPILGIAILLNLYSSGVEYKKRKIKKELDKMKAKDILEK